MLISRRLVLLIAIAAGLFLSVTAVYGVSGNTSIPHKTQSLGEIALALKHQYPEDEPGVLVSVWHEDEEVLRVERGLADITQNRSLSGDSQMRIASLTKQFTAVAVMQLVEAGLVGLDDPVTEYLPDLAPAGDGVTIRHLLNHTSGLPHHTLVFMNEGRVPYDEEANDFLFAPAGTRKDDFMPTNEDVVGLLSEFPDPRFAPGSSWEYSNAGYVLLAQVIEAVAGEPYRDYLRGKLFKPLHMEDSGVFDETRPAPPRLTFSYRVLETGFEERDYSPFNLIHGDGGIYSTLYDLTKWRHAYE